MHVFILRINILQVLSAGSVFRATHSFRRDQIFVVIMASLNVTLGFNRNGQTLYPI